MAQLANARGGNKDLVNQLGQRAEGAENPALTNRKKEIATLLKKQEFEISKALPKMITPERFMRTLFNCMRLAPKLYECEPMSLVAAVMTSAQLGLEPGPLGHAYIIPYWSGKRGCFEAQFQIGYRGMLDLARRGGDVANICANEVYEKDHFEAEYGSHARLIHRPYVDGDRGKVVRYYAYAKTKDDGEYFYIASVSDMQKFMTQFASSKNRQGEIYGPWVDHFDAMALKTCLKQMTKYMPLNIETQTLLAQDETVKTEIEEDMTQVYDLSAEDIQEVPEGGTAVSESAASLESEAEYVGTDSVPTTNPLL